MVTYDKILPVLVVLVCVVGVVPLVSGTKTEIPDLQVRKSGDFHIYSGHVILVETGNPMPKGFIYLVKPGGREIIASTPLVEDGYFELRGPQKGLQLMVTTSEITQRTATKDDVELLKQLDEQIEKMFDEKRYGRKELILRGDAQIVISEKETMLKAQREFDFQSPDIINGESYDCQEAACALKSYVKGMSQFYETYICHVPIPYTLPNGQQSQLNHTVLNVVFKDSPKRTINCFVDATPLAAENIGIPFSPDLYIADKQGLEQEILQRAQKSVTLSPSVPIEVIGDLYVWGGISQRDDEILVSYTIHRCRKSRDRPFQVLDTFTMQLQLHRDSFFSFRQEVAQYDPYTYLQNLPQYAKLVQVGTRDKKMEEIYLKTIPVVFEMIVKAKLAEEVE